MMRVNAYRLWQHWQQMHYPARGLPAVNTLRSQLVTLDGTSGTILERYFRRRPRASKLDTDSLLAIQGCQRELDRLGETLSADASRYFGRLQILIDLVVAQTADGEHAAHPAGSPASAALGTSLLKTRRVAER